jgi:hypothetical protein
MAETFWLSDAQWAAIEPLFVLKRWRQTTKHSHSIAVPRTAPST